MKNLATYFAIMLLAAALCGAGCSKKNADKDKAAKKAAAAKAATPLEEARALLKEQKIDASSLKQGDSGDWSMTVETSDYTEYDAHLVATWGMIFGTLGWFADNTVTIVNTLDGEPVLRIRASVDDIMEMQQGVIDESEFMARWDYESIE